jgi:hypothetical protein
MSRNTNNPNIFRLMIAYLTLLMLLSCFWATACNPPIGGPVPEQFYFSLDSASVNVTQRYYNSSFSITYQRNNRTDTVSNVALESIPFTQANDIMYISIIRGDIMNISTAFGVRRFEVNSGNRTIGIISLSLEEDKSSFYRYKLREVIFNGRTVRPRTDLPTYTFNFPL